MLNLTHNYLVLFKAREQRRTLKLFFKDHSLSKFCPTSTFVTNISLCTSFIALKKLKDCPWRLELSGFVALWDAGSNKRNGVLLNYLAAAHCREPRDFSWQTVCRRDKQSSDGNRLLWFLALIWWCCLWLVWFLGICRADGDVGTFYSPCSCRLDKSSVFGMVALKWRNLHMCRTGLLKAYNLVKRYTVIYLYVSNNYKFTCSRLIKVRCTHQWWLIC